jgi:dienelactone hydrolase
MNRRDFLALTLAAGAAGVLPAGAQTEDLQVIRTRVKDIPTLVVAPKETKGRRLIVWLTGFSGSKEAVEPQLRELARNGFVALSFDPYQHGERRIEPNPQLVSRVRGNIRRYFWPILARSAEETPLVIDWAIKELGVDPEVGMGGLSMGGDISVAAASVDKRIRAVSAVVATPDWMRPGSFEPPGAPDEAAQRDYDRRNPLTHLSLYRHKPAIAFQSGADDRQVPPDGGERFVAALRPIYGRDADRLLKVNLQPKTAHAFTPEMMVNSIAWFKQHLPLRPVRAQEAPRRKTVSPDWD